MQLKRQHSFVILLKIVNKVFSKKTKGTQHFSNKYREYILHQLWTVGYLTKQNETKRNRSFEWNALIFSFLFFSFLFVFVYDGFVDTLLYKKIS